MAFEDFNSYGSRRGNDRVMTRGTFANVRIKNLMLGGEEGGNTLLQPEGTRLSIYDAAVEYRRRGTPLVVLAGQDYGAGSSRDWAAKGTRLLGVRAVVAQSYERIHRSNLVGMGVLPLQFKEGTTAKTLGLDGSETYDVLGLGARAQAPAGPDAARRAEGRRDARCSGPLPDRHPHRDRLLPARGNPALRPAPNPRKVVISETGKAGVPGRRLFRPGGRPHRGQGQLPQQRLPARFHGADAQVGQEHGSSSTSCGAPAWTARSSASSPGSRSSCASRTPKGSLVLTRMGQRNLELVRNLGLHKLLTVDATEAGAGPEACDTPLVERRPGRA